MAEDAMGNDRGFTLIELMVTAGILGVAAAIAIPSMNNAVQRNKVITSAELLAGQVREARLAAISRNRPFRVLFNCPAAGAFRMLEVTGDASIDDDADRCSTPLPNDGPPIYLPTNVGFGGFDPKNLQISARGQGSAVDGGLLPLIYGITYGSHTRNVSVTALGRVTIADE
jgi:prepilin-type N-terminal cleavage/methylation domain-containing protein